MFWIAGASVGLIAFSADIVNVVLSQKWQGAELFLRAQGIALLFGALISNWDVLFKAVNNTRPILIMALIFVLIFAFLFLPPTYFWARSGAALGLVLVNVALLITRKICVDQLRLEISLPRIAWRALLAAGVAAGSAALVGFAPTHSYAGFALRLIVYGAVYTGGLLWLEQDLIAETLDAFRQKRRERAYDSTAVGGLV